MPIRPPMLDDKELPDRPQQIKDLKADIDRGIRSIPGDAQDNLPVAIRDILLLLDRTVALLEDV